MKGKFVSRLFRNFQYKIAALILACLFWYIVQGEEILEVNQRINVTFKVADDYILKGPATRVIDATLRGSRAILSDAASKSLDINIEIPAGRIGPVRYRIDKDYFKDWDNRIKMTVHDPVINVTVDQRDSKKVPVKEYLRGVPADGYIIEKTVIKPNTITISGAKGDLAKIDEILTEPIDVENLSSSKNIEAKLLVKDLPQEALSAEMVTVSLLVGEKKINKRFGSVPVEVVGSDFMTAVKPRFVSIVIQGTPGVLSFIKRSDLEAFVEARDLEPGKKHSKAIQVKIPPETVLIETFPQVATIEVYNQKKQD